VNLLIAFKEDLPAPSRRHMKKLARVEKSKAAGQRLQYLQRTAASSVINCLNHMSVHFKRSNFIASIFKPVVLILVREQWKKVRSITFFLDFFVTFFIKKKSKCQSSDLT